MGSTRKFMFRLDEQTTMTPPAPTDFNFFPGNWQVSHRRLKQRLVTSNDWEEFGGTCKVQTLLVGLGNVDDNVIDLPSAPFPRCHASFLQPGYATMDDLVAGRAGAWAA